MNTAADVTGAGEAAGKESTPKQKGALALTAGGRANSSVTVNKAFVGGLRRQ